jgi:hypothetical protein
VVIKRSQPTPSRRPIVHNTIKSRNNRNERATVRSSVKTKEHSVVHTQVKSYRNGGSTTRITEHTVAHSSNRNTAPGRSPKSRSKGAEKTSEKKRTYVPIIHGREEIAEGGKVRGRRP